jgi:hypothetical protein
VGFVGAGGGGRRGAPAPPPTVREGEGANTMLARE